MVPMLFNFNCINDQEQVHNMVSLNLLQLCVWNANGWEKLASKFLCSLCSGHVPDPPVVNFIQFHQDQVHLLAVHERLIDIYEAPLLNHVLQVIQTVQNLR